jgi:hypothetical protein
MHDPKRLKWRVCRVKEIATSPMKNVSKTGWRERKNHANDVNEVKLGFILKTVIHISKLCKIHNMTAL